MRKWTDIAFSSIYYVLERLEFKGLATGSDTRGKERKRYSITDKGLTTLKDETIKLIAERKSSNTHLMTGLATSELIEIEELTISLKQRRAELRDDLQALYARQSAFENMPRSAQRLFSLSEVLIQAELGWINEELERTKA